MRHPMERLVIKIGMTTTGGSRALCTEILGSEELLRTGISEEFLAVILRSIQLSLARTRPLESSSQPVQTSST